MVLPDPAEGALLVSFRLTGADVTATISGTIDAAWGTRNTVPDVEIDNGGLEDAGAGIRFPGSAYESYRIAYGSGFGYDYFQLSGLAPFTILPGDFITGGVVQPNYAPDFFWLQFGFNQEDYRIEVDGPIGFTSVDTSIVWSDTLLSDFFTSGVPLTTDIYNASNQKLLTLQILDAEPIPEPGTWTAASLLASGAIFMRWRKRAKVS